MNATALLALEYAIIETNWSRLNFRENHAELVALRATLPDSGRDRLKIPADILAWMLPIGQAGVLPNSLSPKTDKGWAMVAYSALLAVQTAGQYCSLCKI